MSDTKRIVQGTVLGAVGGAAIGSTVVIGAKAGAVAGAFAGPLGAVTGAAIGSVMGFGSYWVAKGISALYSSEEDETSDQKADPGDNSSERNEERDDQEEEEDRDEDRDDEDEEESSASEDESSEESTETSDYESQIERTLQRILECPPSAPTSYRLQLYHQLCEALSALLDNPQHRVNINRDDRHLSITVPGFRPIQIPTRIRDNLALFDEVDLGNLLELTADLESINQPYIYRLQCRHCERSYIGQTRDFLRRYIHHRSRVNARARTTLSEHLNTHREYPRTDLEFDNSFEIIIVRELVRNIPRKVIRNWEVFLQWLLKGREKDGGIGKR